MKTSVELSCNASFKQKILINCYEALSAVGFTRYRKENADWPLDNNFHCWVGLNAGLYDDRVEINPFIGVHAVSIERFWLSLKERKYNRGVATYAIHMGSLAPKEEIFKFNHKTNIESEAVRLAKLYLNIGVPYAKSIASYEALLPLLQGRIEMLGGYPESVAGCLYLMGRKEDARDFTENFLNKEKTYFEDFAVPFLEKLKREL